MKITVEDARLESSAIGNNDVIAATAVIQNDSDDTHEVSVSLRTEQLKRSSENIGTIEPGAEKEVRVATGYENIDWTFGDALYVVAEGANNGKLLGKENFATLTIGVDPDSKRAQKGLAERLYNLE